MKLIALIIFLSFNADAAARKCEVYGISDSPQKLNCSFPGKDIALQCKDGEYFLNSESVKAAYHYEVEYGPVPLVFESESMKLIVEIQSKADIVAELERRGQRSLAGTCL